MPRNFSNWLKAYCQFTEHSEAPLEYHFWTGVSTIAAVLRRRVWKDELHFKWTPNFYLILVGPAGVVTKSTTINIGYHFLEQVKDLHFGPDSMTWHGLGKEFEKAVAYHSYVDANGKDQRVLMSPLTCSISELGTFLRPDDPNLISFLTDIWDGKDRPFIHTTANSSQIKIENGWLNLIGATTPAWLQNNFPSSLISEGIGSRIIFIFADKKRHLMAYPSRVKTPATYHDMEQKLLADLNEIATIIGPYELTDEAYKWGEDWYKKHHTTSNPILSSGRFGGYIARKQTHLHKLAMVLSAAKRNALLIEKEDLVEAEAILVGAEASMIRVFESMGVVDTAKYQVELMNFVKGHGWITPNDLYRLCYNIMSERDFKQALRVAIEVGMFEVSMRSGKNGIQLKSRTIN